MGLAAVLVVAAGAYFTGALDPELPVFLQHGRVGTGPNAHHPDGTPLRATLEGAPISARVTSPLWNSAETLPGACVVEGRASAVTLYLDIREPINATTTVTETMLMGFRFNLAAAIDTIVPTQRTVVAYGHRYVCFPSSAMNKYLAGPQGTGRWTVPLGTVHVRNIEFIKEFADVTGGRERSFRVSFTIDPPATNTGKGATPLFKTACVTADDQAKDHWRFGGCR